MEIDLRDDMSLSDPWGTQEDYEGPQRLATAYLANAIQLWSILQSGKATVELAADAFCLSEAQIRQAVEHHYWMSLDGEEICHEGE